jgi:hypothetical protein
MQCVLLLTLQVHCNPLLGYEKTDTYCAVFNAPELAHLDGNNHFKFVNDQTNGFELSFYFFSPFPQKKSETKTNWLFSKLHFIPV